MTFSLVYMSSATELLGLAELVALLEESRCHNEQVGITGALLSQDGNFMQVIEGAEDEVRSLYDRIADDPRHRGLIEILAGPAEREFGDWSMAFGDLADVEAQLGRRLSRQMRGVLATADVPGSEAPGLARQLLVSFSESLNLNSGSLPRSYR